MSTEMGHKYGHTEAQELGHSISYSLDASYIQKQWKQVKVDNRQKEGKWGDFGGTGLNKTNTLNRRPKEPSWLQSEFHHPPGIFIWNPPNKALFLLQAHSHVFTMLHRLSDCLLGFNPSWALGLGINTSSSYPLHPTQTKPGTWQAFSQNVWV